jgi:hypothetical protein
MAALFVVRRDCFHGAMLELLISGMQNPQARITPGKIGHDFKGL